MDTELEDSLADALRARADAVPHTPMPVLGVAVAAPARRRLLVPVAAAVVAAVAVGAAAVVLVPGDDDTSAPVSVASPEVLAQGEVYYSLRLTADGKAIMEKQLWQPRDRAGEWRQQVALGQSVKDGRVVPGSRVGARPGGVCYPAFEASNCVPGSWFNPTVDFLAAAPRDPAALGVQLLEAAVTELRSSMTDKAVMVHALELRCIGEVLAGNGVPADLSGALRQVVAALPGIEVTEDMANLTGQRGTGYSLPVPGREPVTVIFAANGHYLGSPTEAVRHGVAPGLGQPPSRMLD